MKIKVSLLLWVLLLSYNCYSQNYLIRKSDKSDNGCIYVCDSLYGKIYTVPNQSAEFDESETTFFNFITDFTTNDEYNLEIYTDSIIQSFLEIGKLRISVLIDPCGDLKSFIILDQKFREKPQKDYNLLEKCVAVRIPKSPKWIPAKCMNENVTSFRTLQFSMPRFK